MTEDWVCSGCREKLEVAKAEDPQMRWTSIRSEGGSVLLWQEHDGAWWHHHEKTGWTLAKPADV